MALRMLLVAMVVTLSLPIPDKGSCQFFVKELNHEIAGAFVSLRNEIAVSAPNKSTEIVPNTIPPVVANFVDPVAPVAVLSPDRVKSKSIESPADLAFELIQEEFAREASEFTIQEAKAALARIRIMPVDHPLPPAPEAEELFGPFNVFEKLDSVEVVRVTSSEGVWKNLSFMTTDDESITLYSQTLENPVRVSGLGEWSLIIQGICLIENSQEVPPDVLAQFPIKMNSESKWLAILSADENLVSTVEVDDELIGSLSKPTVNAPKTVIKNAIRLTAEAIAAWSQLATNTY